VTISFFLDTNTFILLSGLDEPDLSILREGVVRHGIKLCISHVQLDEQDKLEYNDYQQKIRQALAKFNQSGITLSIEPTNEVVWGVSRFDLCRFGSDKLGEIDDELRREITRCMGKRSKGVLNVAKDALIALSSLNHDYFITADKCLSLSWKLVVEFNEKNKKALEQDGYKLPIVLRRKTTRSVFQTIINLS
jgi:hypothetical protein